jgi:hypothetical protein
MGRAEVGVLGHDSPLLEVGDGCDDGVRRVVAVSQLAGVPGIMAPPRQRAREPGR